MRIIGSTAETVSRVRVELTHYEDGGCDYSVWLYQDRSFSERTLWTVQSRHWPQNSVICPANNKTEGVRFAEYPSETLLSLLRHFHTHRAVAPLLDRLLEEYPQLEEWVNPAELLESVTASEGVA